MIPLKSYLLMLFFFSIFKSGQFKLTDKEYAKLPQIFEWDNYDRCMLLEDEALFCNVRYDLQPIDPENPPPTWNQIMELIKTPKNYRHDILRHSICVPFSCPNVTVSSETEEFKQDITECFNKKYKHMGLHGVIKEIECETSEAPSFDFYDYFAAILFSSYLILLLYASCYEGLARYKTPEEYQEITGTKIGRFLSCFSIFKNWIRLNTVKKTPEIEAFRGIQGIRLYNSILVIMCHCSMWFMFGPVINTKWAESVPEKSLSAFFASGPFAVETFFILSSWFLTYHIFMEFNEHSKKEFTIKTASMILFNRYIRVAFPIAVLVLFNSTLMYHAARGPSWDIVRREREFCRENGWLNLLFLNNQVNTDRMCIIETWYTAADMQFFVLGLVILYFSVKKPKRLFWIVAIIYAIWQVVILNRVYEMNIADLLRPYPEVMYYLKALYAKDGNWIIFTGGTVWNLVGSLVGIVGGYTYYKYKNVKMFTTTSSVALWWLITLNFALGIVVYPGIWLYSNNFYRNPYFTYPYFGLATTIYGIGITTIIIGFANGTGWIAKWICEWRPTYLLSRCTYSIYLVHFPYTIMTRGSLKSLPYASDEMVVLKSIETSVVCIILGALAHLIIELPTSALQNEYLLKRSFIDKDKNEKKVD